MLSVRNVSVVLNGKTILNNLNLDLSDSESLVILGGSGTGKSVLLKAILGLLPLHSGTVSINGEDVAVNPSALREIGMLFQGGALFDSLPVWKNVAFGLIYGRGMHSKEAKAIALEKLRMVDLEPRVANLWPAELSGGMQKRVGLARALALNPKIIFFDEPTTGLDPITGGIVNHLIVRTVQESKAAAITITHDLASVRTIASRVAFLFGGKIIWTGSVEEMEQTAEPHVRQFLDGRVDGPLTSA